MMGIRDLDYFAFMTIKELDETGRVTADTLKTTETLMEFFKDPESAKFRGRRGYGDLYYELLGKLTYLRIQCKRAGLLPIDYYSCYPDPSTAAVRRAAEERIRNRYADTDSIICTGEVDK